MTIDSHHHFWRYNSDEYGWISDKMSVLQRDFLPSDLKKEIDLAGVIGTIAVQARQCLRETNWLLEICKNNDFIKGVVGWIPLSNSNVEEYLEELSEQKKLKGIRHVVQDEPDQDFILRNDFKAGVSLLRQYNLVYDILIFENQLPQAIRFVDKHPGQIFVLDHIAKPLIKQNTLSPWNENIAEMAKRDNVYCKVSGMLTEADWNTWSKEQLQIYFNIVLNAFGAERLMFGSDWPVCLLAGHYQKWIDTFDFFIRNLSRAEQLQIKGQVAEQVYKLND